MKSRLAPIALDVSSVLRRPLSELRGFAYPDGTPMSPRDAQAILVKALQSGQELLSIGANTPQVKLPPPSK